MQSPWQRNALLGGEGTPRNYSLAGVRRLSGLRAGLDAGFIRPGELLNAAKLLSLELNAPLSQRGLEQLENMQETLAKDQFFQTSDIQLAVHSPLDRAIITCKVQPLTTGRTLLPRKPGSEDELAVPVLLNENLRERKPHEYVRKKSFYERINRFVDWLATREEERILLVGHGTHLRTSSAPLVQEWVRGKAMPTPHAEPVHLPPRGRGNRRLAVVPVIARLQPVRPSRAAPLVPPRPLTSERFGCAGGQSALRRSRARRTERLLVSYAAAPGPLAPACSSRVLACQPASAGAPAQRSVPHPEHVIHINVSRYFAPGRPPLPRGLVLPCRALVFAGSAARGWWAGPSESVRLVYGHRHRRSYLTVRV
eukprot:scaffold527_cov368-Prasinococcus_capsulatus_cf.AAC.31